MMIIVKFVAFTLFLAVRAKSDSLLESSNRDKNNDINVNYEEDGYLDSNSTKYFCNICISEDSYIGSNETVVQTPDDKEWTCGSLQEAANRGDFFDESCKILQNFAETCQCRTEVSSKLNEDSPSNGNILTILAIVFLFFLVFGLSATVPIKQLRRQLGNRWALFTGGVMQFIIMPLVGFLAVVSFKNTPSFTEAMGLSLLVVTSSPGGSYSNWWCSLFNADLALSVAMTAVSTILSVFMLPGNLMLYSHLAYGMHDAGADGVVKALDLKSLFVSLAVVMTALLLGFLTSYIFDSKTFMKWANRFASMSGLCLIGVSFLSSSGTEATFWNQEWNFYICVAFPCLVGLSLANLFSRGLARLKEPECVAISIECCYQNTGIAMSVAMTMFSDRQEQAQALAVPLFYSLVQTASVLIYCVVAWKINWTKAPANESLCVVLSTPYELESLDDDEGLKLAEKEMEKLETGTMEDDDMERPSIPSPR